MESGHQVGQGRFTGAGAAYQGDGLSFFNDQVDVVQDSRILIGKADMAEFDPALEGYQLFGIGIIQDGDRGL